MANWEKLDSEFNNFMSKMTKKDWEIWKINRSGRKEIRQASLELKAKLHLFRLMFTKEIKQDFRISEDIKEEDLNPYEINSFSIEIIEEGSSMPRKHLLENIYAIAS